MVPVDLLCGRLAEVDPGKPRAAVNATDNARRASDVGTPEGIPAAQLCTRRCLNECQPPAASSLNARGRDVVAMLRRPIGVHARGRPSTPRCHPETPELPPSFPIRSPGSS